uniref:Uncharacterized protein n=1 Tax=Sus scrofa TaxID=9823 RepID=A0A8D1L8M7_PIG
MNRSGLPLCLLSAVFYLFWTPSAGLKTLHLGSCVITANLQGIRNGFSEIRDSVQARDEIIDIRILKKTQSLQDTKVSAWSMWVLGGNMSLGGGHLNHPCPWPHPPPTTSGLLCSLQISAASFAIY